MKLGIDVRGKKTAADIYVLIFQIISFLPPIYIFVASGYTPLLGKRNILTAVFDFGVSALPRWESLIASYLYRLTSSELAPYFFILSVALILGIIAKRFLTGGYRRSRNLRILFIVLILADLVVRTLPFSFNGTFSYGFSAAAFAFRTVCLVLPLLDIIADHTEKKKKQ